MALWDDLRTLATSMDAEGLTAEAIIVRQAADQVELQTTYVARLEAEPLDSREPVPESLAGVLRSMAAQPDYRRHTLRGFPRVGVRGQRFEPARSTRMRGL